MTGGLADGASAARGSCPREWQLHWAAPTARLRTSVQKLDHRRFPRIRGILPTMKNPYHALLMLIAGATQKELAAQVRCLKIELEIARSKLLKHYYRKAA